MTDNNTTTDTDLNSPRQGSLERAVEGDYEFSITGVISEAWAKTNGCKWTMQLAFSIYFLLAILVVLGMGFVLTMAGFSVDASSEMDGASMGLSVLLQNIVMTAVTVPVGAGIFMLGLQRAQGGQLSAGSVMGYYHKVLPLLMTTILMYVMIFIGFLLLVLPGIYLAIAYYMAVPLVVEKDLSPWEALETSRKAVSKRWFSVWGLFMVLGAINFVATIPLGIGLIWTLPLTVISFGILYRNMFGVEAAG